MAWTMRAKVEEAEEEYIELLEATGDSAEDLESSEQESISFRFF
jgi:hypothetical protein